MLTTKLFYSTPKSFIITAEARDVWGCVYSSMVEYLSSTHKALGSTPSTRKQQQNQPNKAKQKKQEKRYLIKKFGDFYFRISRKLPVMSDFQNKYFSLMLVMPG